MKIGIVSNYPHVFALALAHTLKLGGSVNMKTDLYDGLLFASGTRQERDGVLFNADEACDYDIVVNEESPCDFWIFHFRPVYRELVRMTGTPFPSGGANVILAAEYIAPDLRYGRKFFAAACHLPASADCFECVLEEKDFLTDCYFGMKADFSLDRLSKNYRTMLLDIYNRLHDTSYTRLKQIQVKGVS